jgi:hypothetical protein
MHPKEHFIAYLKLNPVISELNVCIGIASVFDILRYLNIAVNLQTSRNLDYVVGGVAENYFSVGRRLKSPGAVAIFGSVTYSSH